MEKLTAESPESRSADPVAENLIQLRALFPEVFTEGKVDFEVLKQTLGGLVDEREEKYGLNWHGKRRARQSALTPSTGTLLPCPDESVDWNTTQNLMIEGDNLEVLKLLQKSFSGRVKLIYIDPPYNTGKDFVYPDDFQDSIKNYMEITGQVEGGNKLSSNTEASGRFHTDWLNMMYPRLKLSRGLLRDDGVILVSIDDHEIENLRRLCGECFGEENFIACMTWEKGRKNDAKLVSVGHEYLLIFAKSLSRLRELNVIWREEKPGAREIWEQYLTLREKYKIDDNKIEDELQKWYSSLDKKHPAKKWSRYKRIDANGPWRDRDISWPGDGGPRYDVPHPITGLPCKVPESGWRFASPEEMQRQINLGLVVFRDDHTEPPFRKAHIRPIPAEVDTEVLPEEETEAMAAEDATDTPEDEINDSEQEDTEEPEEEFATQVRGSCFYKQSQVSVKYLKKLLGAKVFNNPKDHFELARLFDYVTPRDKNSIIMDFFAGSGSTGHSVMHLNLGDGGNRRFVVVQLPEKLDISKKDQKGPAKYCDKINKPRTIAELTKERLRRAGKHIRANNPEYMGDTGFRVFKLASSNIRAWEPPPDDLTGTLLDAVQHIKEGRSEADILFEILLKLGLDLTVPMEQQIIHDKVVHSIGGGVLLVCLDPAIGAKDYEPLALGLAGWHKELAPAGDTTLVFRDSAFADDVAKTNLTAILSQHGLDNVRSL